MYFDSYLSLYCVTQKSKTCYEAGFPSCEWNTPLSAPTSEAFIDDNIMLGCETCPLPIILQDKPPYTQTQSSPKKKSYLPAYSDKNGFYYCNNYRRSSKPSPKMIE